MEVRLHNHFTSKVYTSGSPISGELVVSTRSDVPFDSVQILFLGCAKTRVDGVQSPHSSTHIFLKIAMPILEGSYPVPRVFEAGRTYKFPFNFVVPQCLTISACNHHAVSDHVHDAHLLLPPTMGGSAWEKDDMAPEMAAVQYQITARVFRERELGNAANTVKLMESSQAIRVLPASEEEAPLDITKHDKGYRLSKSKTIRKSMFAGKLGRLSVSAAQPGAIFLASDGTAVSGSSTVLDLRFEPAAADAPPPRIVGVSGKLLARTFYSSGAMTSFPNLGDDRLTSQFTGEKRGSYSTSVPIFADTYVGDRANSVGWSSIINPHARRDSGYSSGDRSRSRGRKDSPSSTTTEPPFIYISSLPVPVRIDGSAAERKQWLPTFHNCITSRTYALQLTVSFATPGTNASTTVTLVLPVQIAVDATADPAWAAAAAASAAAAAAAEGADEALPSFEMAVFGRAQPSSMSATTGATGSGGRGREASVGNEHDDEEEDDDENDDDEVDALLRPRVLRAPEAQYVGTSTLPGYEGYAAARRRP